MSSTPVVLRLKKRKLPQSHLSANNNAAAAAVDDADSGSDSVAPAFRLLLQQPPDAKRARVAAGAGGNGLFVYAGRVNSADIKAAEAAVRRAIGKRKLGTEAERLRRRLGERPSEGEGRLVYKRRKCSQPTQVVVAKALKMTDSQDTTNTDAATGSSNNQKFRIVDFELAGSRRRSAFGRRPDSEQITCNGVAMTTKVSAANAPAAELVEGHDNGKDSDQQSVQSEDEGEVYYDLYYGYSDACIANGSQSVPGSESQQEHQQMQFLLQAYEEAYSYVDDPDAEASGSCFAILGSGHRGADDADSDSNSESNWRNDYPDTPSSDNDSSDNDPIEDVDPYDVDDDNVDADGYGAAVSGLTGRLGRVRFVEKQSDSDGSGDDGDEDDDDEEEEEDAKMLADWRQFKQKLLTATEAADAGKRIEEK